MAEYRRVTRACACNDWSPCRSHEDVLRRHGATDILRQFKDQKPETWYTQGALRERRRIIRPGSKAPGKRSIGSFKVQGYRAWVWRDDGSVYAISNAFPGSELHWMIAYGNRRLGDRSDLQVKRLALLQDPRDNWRPSDLDYADLLDSHDDGFTSRAVAAIRRAVEIAERNHNTVVDINAAEVGGHVVQEHDEDVEGAVVEEINERWVLLAKRRKGGRPLTFEDSRALAAAAYPDELFPEVVSRRFAIRGDLLVADPSTHFIFYAELDPPARTAG